jgi:hypothetical protein
MIKHAKEQLYMNVEMKTNDLQMSNSKQYWKLLKQLMHSHSYSDVIPPLRSIDNEGNYQLHISNDDKATCLNKYFVSISTLDTSSAVLPPSRNSPFQKFDY